MKKYIASHWFWFFVLVCGYSLYDFIAQIGQADSLFEQHPSEWFLFRFTVTCTFCFVLYFSSHLLCLTRIPKLIADLLAFSLSWFLHLAFVEPLWNRVFWPYGSVHEEVTYPVLAIALLGYIVYRILFLVVFYVIQKLS